LLLANELIKKHFVLENDFTMIDLEIILFNFLQQKKADFRRPSIIMTLSAIRACREEENGKESAVTNSCKSYIIPGIPPPIPAIAAAAFPSSG
jgi:hypothetical protein